MNVFGKIAKYTVGLGLLLCILAITTLAIFLEPAVKISGFIQLDPDKLTTPQYAVTILDNEDDPIADAYQLESIFTPIASVGEQTRDAFISVEDKRFYSHRGIDYIRVLSAAKNDVLAGSFREGASTITQQLVKNTHLSSDKTIERKLQEMRIARDIERNYTKEQILEFYLNALYFGNNLYGIGAAAKTMFAKDVSELTLEESALLAGIINNPSRYNPYSNPEHARARRDLVLSRMKDNGKITESEFEAAKAIEPYVMSDIGRKNCYTRDVLKEAAFILNCPEKDICKHKYKIGTNLEVNFQALIEYALNTAGLPDSVLAQVLVLDNLSGGLMAVSGETQLKRQPGSTVKPVLAYAPAIEQRIAFPASPILDRKTDFSGYAPSNYREQYSDWTSVENALIQSSNVCAVKLLEMAGVENAKSFARRLGFQFEQSDTGLPLALGGMEQGLSLRTVANAYQAFANDGKFIKSSFIRYIEDENGNMIYTKKPEERRVMRDTTAYFINQMLAKCAKEGTARRLDGAATHVCAKTGTVGNENGNTDAYCIAYTPEYTIAVWIGSTDNTSPHHMTGGGVPSSIARNVLLKIAPRNSKGYHKPASIQRIDLDAKELSENHRLILADDNLLPRYRKTAEFPETSIPHKKPVMMPYLGGQTQTFTQSPNYNAIKPMDSYDDIGTNEPLFIPEPNNYEIVA